MHVDYCNFIYKYVFKYIYVFKYVYLLVIEGY